MPQNSNDRAQKETLTICGSFAELDLICRCCQRLEELGFNVLMPTEEFLVEISDVIEYHQGLNTRKDKAEIIKKKRKGMEKYLESISKSDGIFVVNEKNGREYIGLNVALEIGYAFYLGKKIYLLKPTKMLELEAIGAKVLKLWI